MNANTEIDLIALHAAIVADIRAQFPALQTVEFYRGEGQEDRTRLPLPACLLSLTEFEVVSDEDPGTEQLAVSASFDAVFVISFREPDAKLKIRTLAASFATWLRRHTKWRNPTDPAKWLPTGAPEIIGAYRDDFASLMAGQRDQPLDQFEVWKVEWRQQMHLGATVWDDESGTTPTEIWLAQSVNGVRDPELIKVAE